jgi:hypothetical protein
MKTERPARAAELWVGLVLVIAGIGFLLLPALDVDLIAAGWPLFVIVPGLGSLLAAFSGRRGSGGGFLAVPGSIVTITGLLLAYQNVTGDWESWSYAWALVAPGGVGVGLVLAGAREARRGAVQSGAWLIAIGSALFFAGEWIFVRVLGVGGAGLGSIGAVALPGLLVALGVYVIARPLIAGAR